MLQSTSCLALLLLAQTSLGQEYTSDYPAFGPVVSQLTQPVYHGEGPTWDARTNRLYFVDIQRGKVYSYNPDSGETYYISFKGTVTPFVQHRSNPKQFYVGVNRSLFKITWDGQHAVERRENITTVSQNFPTSRFNDGKADKRGRLWFGTMGFEDIRGVAPNAGSLYFFTKTNSGNPQVVVAPVNVSNGLAWNKDNNKFFYIDTPSYSIAQYDYDDPSGAITNRQVLINLQDLLGNDALPDGMTIDVEDNLWVALYGGGAVVHVNSTDGSIIRRIAIPAQYVSSCMWGGRNLDVLFVTTSQVKLNRVQRLQQPAAGSLFAIRGLGTHGLHVFGGSI